LHTSSNINGVIKSRMSCAGHVAHVGEMRNAYNNLTGKPNGKSHLENLGIDGKIILEWFLQK